MTFSHGEQTLSEWLEENACVAWITHPEPWLIEAPAISELYLPLNLKGNKGHPFHRILSGIRKEAKTRARSLPVLAE